MNIDFTLSYHRGVALLTPITQGAHNWADRYLRDKQRYGKSYAVLPAEGYDLSDRLHRTGFSLNIQRLARA